jgi:hypothetical protein
VRLKSETLDEAGRVVATSYFTKIDYEARPSMEELQPRSLPPAPHEALLPPGPPYPTVQAAQPHAPFAIREPSLPEGFQLRGVWVSGQGPRRSVILRYSDRVSSFTLFQFPLGKRAAVRPEGVPRRPRPGIAQWFGSDRVYLAVGQLRPKLLMQVADSLK